MQLAWSPVGGLLLVILIAIGLVALVIALRPSRTSTTMFRRRVLLGLRLAAVALVLLAMLRPTLVHTSTKKQSATLVILCDQSRSMSVSDAVNNQTRWESLRGVLQDAASTLQDLSEDLELQIYTFDTEPRAVAWDVNDWELPELAEGRQTAIGSVLQDVLRLEEGKRLAGVILLSDGAQRAYAPRDVPAQVVARQLFDRGYPLHTVTFGQARGLGQVRDVALRELLVNQTVFVKNQLAVVGTANVEGFAEQVIPIELLFESGSGEMRPVGRAELRPRESGEQLRVELSHEPQLPGEYKLTLKSVPQPGELITTNNELSTFITVLSGGLNVLYLEGALRPEQKFLRQSLDASPDIRVDYLRIDAREPTTRPTDLVERFTPGRYDVYLIGDLDAQALTEEELALLRDSVRQGAGLMMIGGIHSFGAGHYARTPLAEVLPVRMDPLERQPFDEPIRADLHLPSPPKMIPTQLGERHFVMLLDVPSKNESVWRELPPLEGANRFASLQPRTIVLAESEDHAPLLVAGDYGKGRTLAFAGDSTWRWRMQGFDAAHRRFWRQAILWLAHRENKQEGNVWVKLPRRRFAPGERVAITVGAQSAEGAPITDASFDVEVLAPDNKEFSVPVYTEGDTKEGSFADGGMPGDYTISVEATSTAGESLGSAKARFLVWDKDLELDNPAADVGTMTNLAATAGGESVSPEEFASLLERIRNQPLNLDVEVLTKVNLWDGWPLFFMLTGCLITEWFLRKRWGLV